MLVIYWYFYTPDVGALLPNSPWPHKTEGQAGYPTIYMHLFNLESHDTGPTYLSELRN